MKEVKCCMRDYCRSAAGGCNHRDQHNHSASCEMGCAPLIVVEGSLYSQTTHSRSCSDPFQTEKFLQKVEEHHGARPERFSPPPVVCEPDAYTTVGVETKIRMGLLLHFSDGLRKLGEVLHFGCEKYDAPKTGRANDPAARDAIVDSLMRHLTAPERCDPESGLPHSWHVLANALFLAEKDDR